MEVVVSHLTRMNPGHVCAAGFDPATLRPIRPVLERPQLLPVRLCQGRPPRLRVRSVLDLHSARPCGEKPEVEDHECLLGHLVEKKQLLHSELWPMLTKMVKPGLQAIFGKELQPTGKTFSTPAHEGAGSLGYVHPVYRFRLHLEMDRFENEERLKLQYVVHDRTFHLPVTDLRFYTLPDFRIDQKAVNAVNGLFEGSEDVILAVGLTRPFMEKHWLQVNSIYFEKTDWEELLVR
jgi:hypothetical protein